MRSKKLWLILVAILLVTVLCVALFACKNNKPGNTDDPTPGGDDNPVTPGGDPDPTPGGDDNPVTPTPTGDVDNSIPIPADLAIDLQGKATWSRVRVTGVSYRLSVNDTIVEAQFTTSNLLSVDPLPADGHFVVKVCAVVGGVRGPWSDPINYTYQGVALVSPTIDGFEGTVLSWKDNKDALYPLLTIDGVSQQLAKGTTSYDLAAKTACSIELSFVGDGVYHPSSATVRLEYTAAGLAFAAPTNVYMEGDVLHFDRVEGADIYYFKDVYNTITYLSGADINALASNRDGKFLVQSMWAGNTKLPIADSAPTAVTYFNASQGDGSPSHPFRIGNAGEMRYIEYYEAMGQSKYYTLVADIDFAPEGRYSPADDEDYSNFYNLGSLSGVLDGNDHTISNIVVYYKDGYSSIFDNITQYGKICNLRIADNYWRTWTNRTNDGIMHEKGGECAILAYTNRGTIENVTLVSGSVTAVKDGGAGLVAINRGTIRHCTMTAEFSVYGANEAGSMAIYNVGTIEDCINYGTVGGKSSVGGIVGRNAGLVTRCGNERSATVTGDINCGGIVGYNYNVSDGTTMQYNTRVYACYNKGHVVCTAYAGGIAGRNGSDGINEGTGKQANATVAACYNWGTITGVISVAGLVGQNYSATDVNQGYGLYASYNSGDINNIIDGYVAGRIYLSVAACSWAETDLPDIKVHYWRKSGDVVTYTTDWPGVKMAKTTIGTSTFYYVDLPGNINPDNLSGVIFSRVSPTDGKVFNSTADITAAAHYSSAIYYIDSGWTYASLVEPCCGAIAGYNSEAANCYYVRANVGGTTTALGSVATGTIRDCVGYSRADFLTIGDTLNGVLGSNIFAARDNAYPELAWQQAN